MAIISLLSSLPYLHEIITYQSGALKEWIPNFGIQDFLIGDNGKFFNYSSYRNFLFTFFFNFFMFFGWLGWYCSETSKPYRKALLLPLVSIVYQIIIVLASARTSLCNEPQIKIVGTLVLFIVLAYMYFPRKKTPLIRKIALIWLWFFLISLLPYFHDIINTKTDGLRWFVPHFGIEQVLTVSDGSVMGYNSYRIFVYVFMTHLFAQIGWAGWFFDARGKLFRPFLLVPIVFNLYEISIIAINAKASGFNKPDWKLYTVIIIAILIAINLYFNSDKALRLMHKKRAIE